MLKDKRACMDVLQTLRDHKCKPRLLYPAELSITIDGATNIFYYKTKFKQYLSISQALQKWKTPTQGGKLPPQKSKK
jgi:hypothetical protein